MMSSLFAIYFYLYSILRTSLLRKYSSQMTLPTSLPSSVTRLWVFFLALLYVRSLMTRFIVRTENPSSPRVERPVH